METYYRKRSKKAQYQPTVVQMDQCCQKEAGQGSITAAESPLLARLHQVPPPPSSDHCPLLLKEPVNDRDKSMMQNHIKEGYLYEIDHNQLPPRTPVQLRSNIRVVMVCEKTEMTVSVRFPSMESLRAFFNYSRRETHPALDEKFVMGTALAVKVLSRLVPAEIFSEQKSLESFWLISSSAAELLSKDVNVSGKSEKGICLSSELKGNGMVRWGIRRQVKYLGRHKDESDGTADHVNINPQNSSSSFANCVELSQMEIGNDDDHDDEKNEDSGDVGERDEDLEDEEEEEGEGDREDEDEDDDEEEEEEEEDDDDDEEEDEKIKERSNKNLKRKRYSFRNIGLRKPKKEKKPETRKQKQKQHKKKQIKKKKSRSRFKEAVVLRDPKARWSSERYKLAEENLLKVMKAKGSTAENPILRPQLRAEARKKIGDTGLLDHLLKHMAGKLAPGGAERFRRRHNPDGAMEYWLESADLVNIRKDAGVTDPYWVPPPGWKPGDSPTQDPICATELKLLRGEISKIKRDMELMATNKQLEEEVRKLRRELDEIAYAKKRQEESQALLKTTSSHCCISQKLDQFVATSNFDFDSPLVSMDKCKEQLMAISDFVKEMEGKIGKLAPNVEEKAASKDSSLMAPTDPNTIVKKQKVQALIAASESGKDDQKKAAEEKAAKIQRLKSGFRICKPQGTFLWPNMVKDNINSTSSKMLSPRVVVQVEVPTPTSVTSSTASAPPLPPYHHHHSASSLVKPLAEKRAVTVTVSTVSKGPNYEDGANNYTSTTTTTTALINLNDAPNNHPNSMPMLSPSGNTKPWESGACGPSNVMGYDPMECNTKCCSSASSLPSEVSNWLALSNFKSASDESSHG